MKKFIAAFLGVIGLFPALAYRDLETGAFLTRDPAGFVDGPNEYTYVKDNHVKDNPWTHFDPEGLFPDGGLSIYSGMDRPQAFDVANNAAKLTLPVLPFVAVGGVEGIPATVGIMGRVSYVGLQAGGAGATSSAIGSAVNGQVPSISNMNSTAAVSATLGATGALGGEVLSAALPAPKLSVNSGAPQLFENQFPNDPIGIPKVIPNDALATKNAKNLNYVVDADGNLSVGRQFEGPGGGHIDLANGQPVQAAGEVTIANGQVKAIDNASGHYQSNGPGAQSAAETAFQNVGLTIKPGAYVEKSYVPGTGWTPVPPAAPPPKPTTTTTTTTSSP